MPIEEIDQLDVQKVLAPIWHTKADTARKAANRLKIILKHAKAMRINVKGELNFGVTPKDVALYIISKLTTSGLLDIL